MSKKGSESFGQVKRQKELFRGRRTEEPGAEMAVGGDLGPSQHGQRDHDARCCQTVWP